jgi:hypothetical protein
MTIHSTASDGYAGMCLREEYEIARDRLDRGVELMVWALLLYDQIQHWHIDIDAMRHEVGAFKRACLEHKRGH